MYQYTNTCSSQIFLGDVALSREKLASSISVRECFLMVAAKNKQTNIIGNIKGNNSSFVDYVLGLALAPLSK